MEIIRTDDRGIRYKQNFEQAVMDTLQEIKFELQEIKSNKEVINASKN